MPELPQTYVCTVCDRRSYGCRRLDGLEEVAEYAQLGHPEERVCPTCWITLKKELKAVPLNTPRS